MTEVVSVRSGSWRELLGRQYLGASTAGRRCGAVRNKRVPDHLFVAQHRGRHRWPAALRVGDHRVPGGFAVAATAVNPLLMRFGPRVSYLLILSVLRCRHTRMRTSRPPWSCCWWPRTVQGAAGGMLAGLGYVGDQRDAAAARTRASALVSAMWGVSVILGPAMGGVFAQFGIWRWAFGSLVIMTGEGRWCPGTTAWRRRTSRRKRFRGSRCGRCCYCAAASAISVAGLQDSPSATAGLLAAGVAMVAGFVVVDRRARAAVLLPRAAFGPGPLKWMYVTMGLLIAATMVDMYVPLFGQRLAGMVPVAGISSARCWRWDGRSREIASAR